MAILDKVNFKEKENQNILMGIYIKDHSNKVNIMDMDNFNGIMAMYIEAIIKMVKNMGMACLL